MKNSNTCPKCSAQDIIRVISNPSHTADDRIPVGWTVLGAAVPVTRYLCGSCGYSEEWIDSPQDIERIRADHAHQG